MGKITSTLFGVYLRHLREYVKEKLSFEKITDANMLAFIDDEFFSDILAEFLGNENAPIKEVADKLYSEYDSQRCLYNGDKKEQVSLSSLRRLSVIKSILRIIKYSCTIIIESSRGASKLSDYSAFKIMLGDNNLNPQKWVYINEEQFRIRMLWTFYGQNSLRPICPITDFRANDIHDLFGRTKKAPLLVLSNTNYDASIESFVNKYIKRQDKGTVHAFGKTHVMGLFIDNNNESGSVYDKRLENLYHELKEAMAQCDDFKNSSVIFAIEFHPNKAYGVIIVLNMYIFRLEENIGYVLHAFANCKITNRIVSRVFYTKMIKKSIISRIIETCKKHLESQDNNELDMLKHERDNILPGESVLKKEYRLICHMHNGMERGIYKPEIIEYIVYP